MSDGGAPRPLDASGPPAAHHMRGGHHHHHHRFVPHNHHHINPNGPLHVHHLNHQHHIIHHHHQRLPPQAFPHHMHHAHNNWQQPPPQFRQAQRPLAGPLPVHVGGVAMPPLANGVQAPLNAQPALLPFPGPASPQLAPPPPPSPAAGGASPVAPAQPENNMRTIQPDDVLIKQLLNRYAVQGEHDAIDFGQAIGLLDVKECLSVIEANDVTFVVTDTGTGKSSLVPNALINMPGTKVANSQPRRTAAINLANRVASLRTEKVGENVGYWVRGEHCGDVEHCSLMYMTSYTLLLYIIGHPDKIDFTHIIIDEFHERQPDVEVMLGLLKLALTSNLAGKFKIILMSASVELELWKKYFDGLRVGEYSTCQPRYSIHDYYMEEVCRLVGASFNPQGIDPKGTASSLELKNSLFLAKELLRFLAQHAEPKDSILVFLPGRTVVEEISHWISLNLPEQLDPIPWYRDMELAKIQSELKRVATTKKKVYLATDIAEVSLTLPDVVFVVDSGMTKKPRIHPSDRNSIAFPPLELLWCSRSSNRQRRGRVGRVQQGFFFTMVPECYLPDLQDMEPQIANSTIHELSLHTLQVSDNPIGCFNLCRVTPKDCSIQLSMSVLQDGGFVLNSEHPFAAAETVETESSKKWREVIRDCDQNSGLKGSLYRTTLKGKIAQHLPLGIEASSIVYLGLLFGLESLMILAAAIASCGSPFYSLTDSPDRSARRAANKKTQRIMESMSLGLKSDIIASLAVTIEYKKQHASGLSELGEGNWCDGNSVMRSRLADILRLEAQIKEQLKEQVSFLDVTDHAELEASLKRNAELVSHLTAAAHLERALFVRNDMRKAQKEKSVGPSVFLGLDALSDYDVASVCPWDVGHIVIPISIQTRYQKLLGSQATQLHPKLFNVLLLTLAPQIVYQHRENNEYMFGVEMYGTKQKMRCDGESAREILLIRQALCVKLHLLRKQLEGPIDPLDPVLDTHLASFGVRLPPSVSQAKVLSAFLGFALGSSVKNVLTTAGRVVEPANQDTTFKPTSWSMLVSCSDGRLPYVPPQAPPPPPPPQTLASPLGAPGAPFIEDDE